jgi:hypothetical protein
MSHQGGKVSARDAISRILVTLAKSIVPRWSATEPLCRDCDRRDRCGLPPHRDCIVKAEQLAPDGERPSKRKLPVPYWSHYPPPPFRFVSVSRVRAMDRTAQLREKYQSACKSYGSTCICRGTPQDPCAGRWRRPNRTGRAAVYMSSPSEPRPVVHRWRPRRKYRKPTGVISFVIPPPKSRCCPAFGCAIVVAGGIH